MENYLRQRVRERLAALGINPFEAARRVGAERTFISDLLTGKKETIRQKLIPKVAEVLDCDPEFLVGAQAVPRRAKCDGSGVMTLAGICEAGVWRDHSADKAPVALPVSPDPRYPPERQLAFVLRGHHADGLGLMDGDVLVALRDAPAREGDIVISRRIRDAGETELSVRRITSDQGTEGFDVLGIVINAHRVFGRN